MAFDSRAGLLAVATLAGYVAVLDPSGREDPLRVRVPTANRKPIRGALLAEADSTASLALQNTPTEADPSNVAIFQLRESHGEDVLHFSAGKGEIQRLSASTQTLRLAAIGCTRSPHAADCSRDDPYEVTVWQFADRMDAPKQIVSLTSRDFISRDFKGKAPLRAILSPDGQWLVISFRAGSALPVLRLDNPGKGIWIGSNLQRVKEIAFSEDSKIFAAGGCCATDEQAGGRDQIRLWSVDRSGFTPTGSPLTLTRLAASVQELAFADQKGRSMLLIGGRTGTIDLWDLQTKQSTELRVDTHGVSFIAFSRRESMVATADSQGIVRVWDTSAWPPLRLTSPADDPAVPGFLAFAGDGARLVSSADKVDFWDLDPASLQRKVCALLRELGPNGVDGDSPWHGNKECKEGALTFPPRSLLERIGDFFTRAWAAVQFPSSSS